MRPATGFLHDTGLHIDIIYRKYKNKEFDLFLVQD